MATNQDLRLSPETKLASFALILEFPVTMRQEVDGSPQGKVIGDSFPEDQKSKMRKAGQLREEAGPCPDHVFLIPEVWRCLQPHMHRKPPWRSMESGAN